MFEKLKHSYIYDKKQLKHAITAAGLLVLFFELLCIFFLYFYFALIGVLYGSQTEMGSFLKLVKQGYNIWCTKIPMGQFVMNMIAQLSALILAVFIVNTIYKFFSFKNIFKKPDMIASEHFSKSGYPIKTSQALFFLIPMAIGINLITSQITQVIKEIIEKNGTTVGTPDFGFSNNSIPEIVIMFTTLCIFAPICEEFLFRGCIIQILKPYSNKFAVIISALFFGLIHQNIPQAVPAFTIAILFGIIAIKANSIIPCIITHATINFLSFITTLTQNTRFEILVNNLIGLFIIFFEGIAIIFIIYELLVGGNYLKLQKRNNYLLPSKFVKAFFTNIVFLILIIFFVYRISTSIY